MAGPFDETTNDLTDERDYQEGFYSEEAERIFASKILQHTRREHVKNLLRRTPTGSRSRVLSLGCGDGEFERLLAPHVGEIVGIDLSAVAIKRASDFAERGGINNAVFLQGDLASQSLEQFGRFDTVVGCGFLHHIPDAALPALMSDARRVLVPGGFLYTEDPNVRRVLRAFTFLVRKTYDKFHSLDERELDPRVITALAERAGFTSPRVICDDFFLGPLGWVLPDLPTWVVKPLAMIDAALRHTPLLNRFGSSFVLVACSG